MPDSLQSDHDGKLIAIGLGVLFGFDLAIVLGLMLAVGASLRDMLLVLALVLGATFAALFMVTRMLWIPWQRRYPAQPLLESAVSRSMQSFAFGPLSRFNNALRILVDEHHLHICPFILLAPFGAKRLSIPWEHITDVRPGFWPGTLAAKLDGHSISGPAWCMKLAAADLGANSETESSDSGLQPEQHESQ